MSKFEEPECVEEAEERLADLKVMYLDVGAALNLSKDSDRVHPQTGEEFSEEEYKEWRKKAFVKQKYVQQEIVYLNGWLKTQNRKEYESKKFTGQSWKTEVNQKLDRILELLEGK